MMTGSRRRSPFGVLGSFTLLGVLLGCSSRPDIVGHNSEAQEWAAEQRRAEAEQGSKLGPNWPQNTAPDDRAAPAPQATPASPQAQPPSPAPAQPQPTPQAPAQPSAPAQPQ